MKNLMIALCLALPLVSQAEMLMEYYISSPLYGPFFTERITVDTNGEASYTFQKELNSEEVTEVIALLPEATVANLKAKIESLDGTSPLVTNTDGPPPPRAHVFITMTVKKAGKDFVIMKNDYGTEYHLEYGVGSHLEDVLRGLFVLARK